MFLSIIIIINILILLLVVIFDNKSHNRLAMCMNYDAQEKSQNLFEL